MTKLALRQIVRRCLRGRFDPWLIQEPSVANTLTRSVSEGEGSKRPQIQSVLERSPSLALRMILRRRKVHRAVTSLIALHLRGGDSEERTFQLGV